MRQLLTGLLLLQLLFIPVAAQAQTPGCEANGALVGTEFCDEAGGPAGNPIFGPNGYLTEAIEIMSVIVGVAAVIVIIIGGFMIVLSRGDPARYAKGRNAMIYALVGLVVSIFARVIVAFVLSSI